MPTVKTAITNLIQWVMTYPLLAFLCSLLVVLFSTFVAVVFCGTVEAWVGQRLGLSAIWGLSKKNEILTFLGIGMGGILLALQAVIANRRAKAMEESAQAQADTARAQAKATEEQAKANQNTEQGQLQERLKNAIEHLGHVSEKGRLKMGNKLVKEQSPKIDEVDIPLLIRITHDFAEAADVVEKHVIHRSLRSDTQNTVWDWMSMKTVSHFNLGTALELLLKLLLLRSGRGYTHTHGLTDLYLALPEKVQTYLQATYGKSAGSGTLKLVALTTTPPEQQQRPQDRPIATIRDMLEYFDKDVKLHQKRYSWDPAQKQQWRHFIDNPSVFVKCIHRVLDEETEKFNQEDRVKRGGTEPA